MAGEVDGVVGREVLEDLGGTRAVKAGSSVAEYGPDVFGLLRGIGQSILPGVVGIVTRSSRESPWSSVSGSSRVYDRALMVGMYDETARSSVLRVDPAEWSPAAWNGAIASGPTPIHQIRLLGSRFNFSRTGSTAVSQSQSRKSAIFRFRAG